MGYKYWTAAEDAELVLMREAKVPTKIIARDLKRSPSSVINRIHQKDLPYGKPSVIDQIASVGVAFGEPDTVQKEQEKQASEMQSLRNALEEMEEDIKPSNWFPRLKRWLGF
tara:strand:- start:1355 stop:1690 length:336 start_codon:yes stop_codon:yes gene_type:complete